MTIVVSISQFRKHIADYISKAKEGHTVILKDDKKSQAVAQITKTKPFDKDAYEKALRKAAGIFTAENHPEWRTESDVENWLRKSRLADDRTF